MRTYSGYRTGNEPPGPQMSKRPSFILMLVVFVIFMVFIFNGRGFGPAAGPAGVSGDGAIRFYYVVSGREPRLEHIDITFAPGSVSDVLEALEQGFKEPPRGRDFLPVISSDVYINRVVAYDNTVEIDFNVNPFPGGLGRNELNMAVDAVAFTLMDMYNANMVFITVDGEVLRIVEK